MRTKIIGILLLLSLLLLTSCKTKLVENSGEAEALWFHEHNHYSVSITAGNTIFNKIIRGGAGFDKPDVRIIKDVSMGNPIRYEIRYWYNEFYGWTKKEDGYIRIHIRSIDDINGAGWNHGKFGKGTTSRVQ